MEERNEQIEKSLSGKDEFIASDIFKVIGPNFKLKDDVTVTVTLGKNLSKRHKVKVKLMRRGVWQKEDATLEKGKAEFKTKELEIFFIIGDIITKKVTVSPQGRTVKVDDTSKMEVDIPAGAVDADTDMDFKIIPPDASAMGKYLKGSNPVCKSVVGITECLYGDSQTTFAFKKPVTVKLPFEDKSGNKEKITLVLFRMSGNEIGMMERSTKYGLSEGVCSVQVSTFSGYFAANVKVDALVDVKSIENEARLLFGKNYIATILIFSVKEKMPTGFPPFWIEIVDKVDVDKTVIKRTLDEGMSELPNSRSPDIRVSDGYRLRIDIVGNLRGLRDIPKSYYLITYLDVADDNHKVFTVEQKGEEKHKVGIINFYSDKGNKECVHSVQINTDNLEKEKGSYTRSSLRSESRPKGSDIDDDGFSGYASNTPISNDNVSVKAKGPDSLERQNSISSIGSATTLLSQAPLCQALTEASLFNMAEMVKEDDGLKLSIQLGMSDDYENISQSSQSQRAVVFKLLKEWLKKQTNKVEAVAALNQGLKSAKLKKVADIFMKAVKKDKAV